MIMNKMRINSTLWKKLTKRQQERALRNYKKSLGL